MKFYGLKNCDTCRKAIKALEGAGHKIETVDVRADGVAVEQIVKWLATVPAEKLLNTRSTTWRGLTQRDKAKADKTEELPGLLQQHPTLIKRPVIEHDGDITVGWTKDVQAGLL